jgi:hypothetical protein
MVSWRLECYRDGEGKKEKGKRKKEKTLNTQQLTCPEIG